MMESIFFYIMTNPDWSRKYKYGVTKNLNQRIYNGYEQHSSRKQYLKIYKIKLPTENTHYQEIDNFISILGRNKHKLDLMERKIYPNSLSNIRLVLENNLLVEEDGGQEFIKEHGLPVIHNINYDDFKYLGLVVEMEYSETEIEEINEMNREKINRKNKSRIDNLNEFMLTFSKPKKYVPFTIPNELTPFDYQREILEKVPNFYNENETGKLIWACGLGKALFSLFVALKLGCKNILVGVPSRNLVIQFKKEAKKLFNSKFILGICSAEEMTTNKKEIEDFINNNTNKIIIVTYHSCSIIDKLCERLEFRFDFKIGDECHHLAGIKYNNKVDDEVTQFKKFLYIPSKKNLYMTATEKIVVDNKDKPFVSMDQEEIFGQLIDKKTVNWAIENGKITDYNICVYRNTENQIDYILDRIGIEVNNKELFMSAFMTLKSLVEIDNLSHILLYTNKTSNSDLAYQYIKQILQTDLIQIDTDNLYCESLHSNMRNQGEYDHRLSFNITNEVEKFKEAKMGIICCVQIFGEGFDLPKLNGVVIGESMDSEIRIVQSCLRPHRREKGNPDKKAYVLCPFIDKRDYRNIQDNESFKKIKQILYHLRNTDESVVQKMVLYDFKPSYSQSRSTDVQAELVRNENHLEIFKIRCRSAISLGSDSQHLDEYEFVKLINRELGLLNMKDYFDRQMEHSYFVEDPEQYFSRIGVWLHWYDFLNIDTSAFLPNKEEWKKRCRELSVKTLDQYQLKNKEYPELPENPGDFYPDFSNIPYELNPSGGRRRR